MAKDVWESLRKRILCIEASSISMGGCTELDEMFRTQLEMQVMVSGNAVDQGLSGPEKDLGKVGIRMVDPRWRQHLIENALACNAEIAEILEWTPWKSWKQYKELPSENSIQNAKLEVIDAYCFLKNIWHLLGGTPEEFYAMYLAKAEENKRRQRDGYVHSTGDRG